MKNKDRLKGVILAGGKGTRLMPFSTKYPKPILPIGNKSILQHQIESMKKLGIEDIIIVIGHLGFEIVRALGDGSKYDVSIKYIEQGDTLGIAHALGRLEPIIDAPFLLFLGDIFFIVDDLQPMIDLFFSEHIHGVLAVKREDDKDSIRKNFSIVLDENNFVKRVIEKPRYITNNIKGCGLYLFDLCIFDAIRRTPRTAGRDEYEITDSIQIMIDDGFKVKMANVILEDMNVSYPKDILKCNQTYLELLKKNYIIGDNVKIPPQAKVINSVIGSDVNIENPIVIKDSLIFSGTVVSTKKDVNSSIMTPEHTVNLLTNL